MTDLSKSDYLKRYTSAGDNDKKKKKKSKNKEKDSDRPPKRQLAGIRIIETDAFAPVAAASDIEDVDSDEELEIQMLNEEIRNKAKKGTMKGGFKSTFTSIDGLAIKSEPLDEQPEHTNGEEIKEETSTIEETKFQMSLTGKTNTETAAKEQNVSQASRTRRRHDSDSDEPESRVQRQTITKDAGRKENRSPKRIRHDSDNSPPRKRRHDSSDESPPRRKRYDSDNSPPRRRHDDAKGEPSRRRQRKDSDNSPVRRKRHDSDESPSRRRQHNDSDQSPPRSRRRKDSDQSPQRAIPEQKQKTLDGKIAGLQSAKDLQEESDRLRARKAQMFDELDPAVSGRDAETQVRKTQVKRGRRDKPEDIEKKEREAKKQAELVEKYKEWNKGAKQLKDRQEQLDELARVVAGPMTRTAEDVDMNQYLKEKIHEADPMASMIKKKNREEAIDRGDLVYPTYDKPYPPNRYGIRPGYRWDGVDRSNGFEAKLAISQNARQAVEKEIYSNSNVFD